MDDRIKNVMAAAFEIDVADISDDASPDTIAAWDSIGHMKLVLALEEEFDIQLSDDQIPEMMNFKLIRLIVTECLNLNV